MQASCFNPTSLLLLETLHLVSVRDTSMRLERQKTRKIHQSFEIVLKHPLNTHLDKRQDSWLSLVISGHSLVVVVSLVLCEFYPGSSILAVPSPSSWEPSTLACKLRCLGLHSKEFQKQIPDQRIQMKVFQWGGHPRKHQWGVEKGGREKGIIKTAPN